MPHIWKILHHIMGSLFQLKYVIVGNRAATLPLPLPAVPQALPPSRQIRARTVLFFQQRSKHTVLVNRIFFSCTELHRAHSASTAQCSVLAASFESPWSMSACSLSHQLQLCAAAVDGGNWFTRLEMCHVRALLQQPSAASPHRRWDASGKIGVQLNQTQITFRSDWEFSTY